MNCLLIDDNPKTAKVLAEMLQSIPHVSAVHHSVQPYMIRSLMAAEPIDLVLIRTRLWNFKVFERLDYMPMVLFLSGGKDKLTTQPGTTVPYQIREPYGLSELRQLLKGMQKERIIETPSYFFVRSDGRFHRLFFEDIEMLERMEMSYVKIWTRYTTMLVGGTLNQLLEQLPQGRFIRVSDTLILPLQQAIAIEDDSYTFRGRVIPLTYRFAASARKEMEQQSNWSSWPSD